MSKKHICTICERCGKDAAVKCYGGYYICSGCREVGGGETKIQKYFRKFKEKLKITHK